LAKNADTHRRRIITDGSAGGAGLSRLTVFSSPSGSGTKWQIEPHTPYLVCVPRAGNGATGSLRLYGVDGGIIAGNTFQERE